MTRLLISGALLAVAGLTACVHQSEAYRTGTDAVDHTTTLNKYHWTMNRAVDSSGTSDPNWLRPDNDRNPVTLTFTDQRLSVSGLCNTMGAGYDIDESTIRIYNVVSTMMMCPDESLMRYEQAFGQRLEQAVTWHITRMDDEPVHQPSLTLRFPDNAQWVLTGVPTAEAKYGGPGETLFLEVAPERVACSHPLIADHQCLQVRTVHYDASGLKQSHGPWEHFYDSIENYQHTPGVRHVLRVKRYTRQNVPADSSRYAYILDIVVETDTSGN